MCTATSLLLKLVVLIACALSVSSNDSAEDMWRVFTDFYESLLEKSADADTCSMSVCRCPPFSLLCTDDDMDGSNTDLKYITLNCRDTDTIASGTLTPGVFTAGFSRLTLHYCSISGTLPDLEGTLSTITHLSLIGNQITGSIPGGYFAKEMSSFAVTTNQFSGELPFEALKRVRETLRVFRVGNNLNIRGNLTWLTEADGDQSPQIPDPRNMKISRFDVFDTKIEGVLPLDFLLQMPLLKFLFIARNGELDSASGTYSKGLEVTSSISGNTGPLNREMTVFRVADVKFRGGVTVFRNIQRTNGFWPDGMTQFGLSGFAHQSLGRVPFPMEWESWNSLTYLNFQAYPNPDLDHFVEWDPADFPHRIRKLKQLYLRKVDTSDLDVDGLIARNNSLARIAIRDFTRLDLASGENFLRKSDEELITMVIADGEFAPFDISTEVLRLPLEHCTLIPSEPATCEACSTGNEPCLVSLGCFCTPAPVPGMDDEDTKQPTPVPTNTPPTPARIPIDDDFPPAPPPVYVTFAPIMSPTRSSVTASPETPQVEPTASPTMKAVVPEDVSPQTLEIEIWYIVGGVGAFLLLCCCLALTCLVLFKNKRRSRSRGRGSMRLKRSTGNRSAHGSRRASRQLSPNFPVVPSHQHQQIVVPRVQPKPEHIQTTHLERRPAAQPQTKAPKPTPTPIPTSVPPPSQYDVVEAKAPKTSPPPSSMYESVADAFGGGGAAPTQYESVDSAL